MAKNKFHSGFVSIVGRPNVGKSTLLNSLVGQKVAIMSDKAQTTRNKIQAVYTGDDVQIVFIDTPGIHKPKHALGDFMVKSAYSSLKDVDIVLFMVDATQKIGPGDRFIMEQLENVKSPVYLLINKIDQVTPDDLIPIITTYTEEFDFKEVFPVSAREGINVSELLTKLIEEMPEGPQYYPSNQIVDHPEYFLVQEFIREKILLLTREEIPHSVAVQVTNMHRNEDDSIDIEAEIIVERNSQKGIIIGKQGSMIKKIGQLARRDIENLLGSKVYLNTWVRVAKNWRDRQASLQEYGYRPDNY